MDRTKENISISWGRPNSLFLEPAHFSIFILPVLYLAIKDGKHVLSILFFISTITSTSSTGIIGSALILVLIIFKSKIINIHKIILLLFITLPIILLVLPDSLYNTAIYSVEKINNVDFKSNIRLVGTSNIFEYLNNKEFIGGIGSNQLANYMLYHSISNPNNYANSFFMIFFSFGIIGFFLFILYIILQFKTSDIGFIIIFTFILLTDQIIFNQNFLYITLVTKLFDTNFYSLKNENSTSN